MLIHCVVKPQLALKTKNKSGSISVIPKIGSKFSRTYFDENSSKVSISMPSDFELWALKLDDWTVYEASQKDCTCESSIEDERQWQPGCWGIETERQHVASRDQRSREHRWRWWRHSPSASRIRSASRRLFDTAMSTRVAILRLPVVLITGVMNITHTVYWPPAKRRGI